MRITVRLPLVWRERVRLLLSNESAASVLALSIAPAVFSFLSRCHRNNSHAHTHKSVWSDVFQEIRHLESRRRRTSRLPTSSVIYLWIYLFYYWCVYCKKMDVKSRIHRAISITDTKKGKVIPKHSRSTVLPGCCPKRAVRTNNFILSDVRAPSMHCSINRALMVVWLLFCPSSWCYCSFSHHC